MPSPRARRSPMIRRRMVTGIGPARQLARHEREHRRIAQQQKQQNQSELLAAVSDRLRKEDMIVAAPEPLAKERPKNTSRSVVEKAKEVREFLLLQAQKAFGSGENEKLRAIAFLKYAFTLDDTSRVTETLIHECEMAPKTPEGGSSFLQNASDLTMSLLTEAENAFESMEKAHREWLRRVDGGENAHARSDLLDAVAAIRTGALTFGTQITEFMRQLESTDDFATLKSAAAAFFAGENEMALATRELADARRQFSIIIKQAEADGKQVLARVRGELALLVDEATRLRDSVSGDVKTSIEQIRAQISSKLEDTRARPVMDLLIELESDDYVSGYRVVLDGLKRRLVASKAPKGVQPAPATEPTPKEKAEEDLQRLLGVVTEKQKINGLQVDGIINQLSIICSVSSSTFFASIQDAKFNVPAIIAEKWVNGLHFVKEDNVDGRCDTIRKILRVFEIAYIMQYAATAAAGHIHTPWFALSKHPDVTDAGTADLPNLIHAISSMYDDGSDASALPPHSAYKFIREVVAHQEHAGKSELQDLVDTANRLIEEENKLMNELRIGIVIPSIPYDPLEQRTKVMITETFERGAREDAIKMFFENKHPNVAQDPKAYYESEYDTYEIRANQSGASLYDACKRALSDYKDAYERFLSVTSYADAVNFHSLVQKRDEELHYAIQDHQVQGASVVIPESATCSSIKEMLKEEQSRTRPSSIDDFIDALHKARAISAYAYQDLQNVGITATFQYCTDGTLELLSKMHFRIHEYDEVDTTKFLEALELLTRITLNFNADTKIFFYDGTSTSAVCSLIGLYNEQSKWTQQSSVSNLEETIRLFTIATGTQYRECNSIFEGDRELKSVLQKAPVKALTFVLSSLLVTGHIRTTVYAILDTKKKGGDSRLRLAVLISISLKIIDSALLAHGIFTHTERIAAEWVGLLQYRALRVNFSDAKQPVELLSHGMKVCHFPPFAAYAKLHTATFDNEKAREHCKSEAQIIIRLQKDTVLTRISTQESGQNLQDLVSKEIATKFGSTKRRRYAASPWTAV
jgi:hypothetical protein